MQSQGSSNTRRHESWSKPFSLLLTIALGAGTAIAATNLYVPTSGARETRQLLEAQIRNRNQSINHTAELLTELSGEIAVLQTSVLAADDPVIATQLQIDELHNGRTALTGPGMVITLSDGGGGLTEITSDHLVRDVDLQQVVSALWAAGAEAIAIGDQRLTMTTAIRNAGDAVLIDLVPVLGPVFQVTALGNPTELDAGWQSSGILEYLAMLGTEFGISFSTTISSSLEVPSATPTVLRYAEPLESIADS